MSHGRAVLELREEFAGGEKADAGGRAHACSGGSIRGGWGIDEMGVEG